MPIYRSAYENQQDGLALSDDEIVSAFKMVIDMWFESDSNLEVFPIEEYIENVLFLMEGKGRSRYYDALKNEGIYVVETDGSVFSEADNIDPKYCHGNIFKESLVHLKASNGYRNAVIEAHQRMLQACSSCKYWGACPGFFMAQSTPFERRIDEGGRIKCTIAAPLQHYVEQNLKESLINRKKNKS